MALDPAIETYLKRALPHFMAGKSVAEAMAAVLEDDARLLTASLKRSEGQFFPTPCERGRAHQTATQTGDVIASELSSRVYAQLRAAAPLAA